MQRSDRSRTVHCSLLARLALGAAAGLAASGAHAQSKAVEAEPGVDASWTFVAGGDADHAELMKTADPVGRPILRGSPPPSNDSCGDARVIPTVAESFDPFLPDTAGATVALCDVQEDCELNNVGVSNSVRYQFTAPCDGLMGVNTNGSDYDTAVSVWTRCGGGLPPHASSSATSSSSSRATTTGTRGCSRRSSASPWPAARRASSRWPTTTPPRRAGCRTSTSGSRRARGPRTTRAPRRSSSRRSPRRTTPRRTARSARPCRSSPSTSRSRTARRWTWA